jgi:hypothetical protein
MSIVSRGLAQDDVQIDVVVQRKLPAALGPAGDVAEMDPLMLLVEEIGDYLAALPRG